MKKLFYPRLALIGIKNDRRMYLPYILTCVGVGAVFYILLFLVLSGILGSIRGGYSLSIVLKFGSVVVGVFALIFLFYTNSFLIRRRKKEFGLYNVLGMNKRNLARLLLAETIIILVISLIGGLALGIALSKLAELGLVNIVDADISYNFCISPKAALWTVILYSAIFLLIYLNALRQLSKSKPTELLKSQNLGEKPPKANWVMGVLGIILLACAYYIAVSIKQPLEAMFWFFIAVIMVIIATYMIFISGSVMLCRILQKNKSYYYNPKHFVSVSSMVYRMKRNGAGLASICILATMVLVMISSTSCLNFGKEDSMNTLYPYDYMISLSYDGYEHMQSEDTSEFKSAVEDLMAKNGGIKAQVCARTVTVCGIQNGSFIDIESSEDETNLEAVKGIAYISIVPFSDYLDMTGEKLSLNDGEAMVFTTKKPYEYDSIEIGSLAEYKVVETGLDFPMGFESSNLTAGSICVVVSDFDNLAKALDSMRAYDGSSLAGFEWRYQLDSALSDSEQEELSSELWSMPGIFHTGGYSMGSKAGAVADFYGTYGGLFFLGIMLSIVFLFGAVLIIYYKQVSEGYEDASRFDIMQKVGMTAEDIRRSINSQLLTVFFLPLFFAVLHLAFAFPMIQKLLLLFSVTNTGLLIITAAVSVGIFALFYVIVYRATSNAYYSIVKGDSE